MTVKQRIEKLRHEAISCGCSGCSQFRRVTEYWADLLEVDYERELMELAKGGGADLAALEKACEEMLDGDTFKAVMQAKRRIKDGGAG